MRYGTIILYSLVFLAVMLLQIANTAEAQVGKAAEFPQTGVLAANGNLPAGNLALPQLPMGLDGRKVPFVGSLLLAKDGRWNFGITNNTDSVINLVVELVQYDSERNRIASSSAKLKVAAGAEVVEQAQASAKATASVLILKSWNMAK